ncbi:MAG: hypothetical protein KY456_13865, partial [Chloroflexi bacterium]|nr:hypothetical protein [Chloroflexota bacterium]
PLVWPGGLPGQAGTRALGGGMGVYGMAFELPRLLLWGVCVDGLIWLLRQTLIAGGAWLARLRRLVGR